MAIKILIRKQSFISYYKRALKEMFEIDGDTLIISTGYINNSSDLKNKLCIDEITSWISEKILDERLTIKIFCGKGKDTILQSKAFCKELKHTVNNKNLNLELFLANKMNWHGKVCIKKDINNNYAALIGSSNFTPINLIESKYNYNFNMESDIYFLNKKSVKDKKSFDEMKFNLEELKKISVEMKEFIFILVLNFYEIIGEKTSKEKLRNKIKKASNENIRNSCKKRKNEIENKKIVISKDKKLNSLNILKDIEMLSYELDELDKFINLIEEVNLYEKKLDILQKCCEENGDIDRKKIVENIKKIKQNRLCLEYNNILEKYTDLLKLYDKYMMSYDIQLMGYKTKDLIDELSFKIEEILSNKDMVRLCKDWDE